jgi:hypothetical protein
MTWLEISAGMLGSILDALGKKVGFSRGFRGITIMGKVLLRYDVVVDVRYQSVVYGDRVEDSR